MSSDLHYIVSDLHLGNDYFHYRAFMSWLDQMPTGAVLVLNGDIIDDPKKPLRSEHAKVLERIVSESYGRKVIWIYGNHDTHMNLEDTGEIFFAEEWSLGDSLLIMHGHKLDDIMPRHALFKWIFRRFHHICKAFGLNNMHVAQYAKRWGYLYRILNERVAQNGIAVARKKGFNAIACGHTHFAMNTHNIDTQYFNSGAWTEVPLHYISVRAPVVTLHQWNDD